MSCRHAVTSGLTHAAWSSVSAGGSDDSGMRTVKVSHAERASEQASKQRGVAAVTHRRGGRWRRAA